MVGSIPLGPGAGREYGGLCGDLNPIHLHALSAQLFGFKRPIAHALYITAKAEAALRRAGAHRGPGPGPGQGQGQGCTATAACLPCK